MKISEFGLFVVRVTGMIMFIQGLIELPEYLNYFLKKIDEFDLASFASIIFLPASMPVIIGLILIFFPFSILKKILFRSDIKVTNDLLCLGMNDRIIVVVLGLYVLVESLSDIVFHISNFLILKSSVTQSISIDAYNYPVIIASFIEVFISLLIIWKSKYISLIGKSTD